MLNLLCEEIRKKPLQTYIESRMSSLPAQFWPLTYITQSPAPGEGKKEGTCLLLDLTFLYPHTDIMDVHKYYPLPVTKTRHSDVRRESVPRPWSPEPFYSPVFPQNL